VIGTHRPAQPDVSFADLGLIIVDEEHRFGVKHKERLKQLKLETDVLTLTATPIPRTLHLSLAGLRDMTLMQTPPRDRSPVLTFVEPGDDDGLLDEGISRELDRGGQVFFVHNRIETIIAQADRVRRIVPRARVAVAHGQMRERELEDIMHRFVSGEVDVLVSTLIVESGLDVPNANTMFVNRADNLGLAQLYQLRGRVGRSHRRAYCYLLVPDSVDPDAERRLQVLEHHTELGAGYKIALKDMEMRGAGNLLGAEQSGYVHAVGFDLYLRMLDETGAAAHAWRERAEASACRRLDGHSRPISPTTTSSRRRRSWTSTNASRATRLPRRSKRCGPSCATVSARCHHRPKPCSPWHSSGWSGVRWGSRGSWCVARKPVLPLGIPQFRA
jgi:transcription-repair coupling factor (superfamily II helicase)